jgi:hypothetical protein
MEEAQVVEEVSNPNYRSIREREEVEGKKNHLHPKGFLFLIEELVDAHHINLIK